MQFPESIPVLWYENSAGERWTPPENEIHDPPHGYCYQHVRLPFELIHRVHGPKATSRTLFGRWAAHRMHRLANALYDDGRPVAEGSSTWSADLVDAMVRDGMTSTRAIQIAAMSCERCLNVLLHRYDTGDGYPEGGDAWQRAGTECEFCTDG